MKIQYAIVHEAPSVNSAMSKPKLAEDITPLGNVVFWEERINLLLESQKALEIEPIDRTTNIVLKEFEFIKKGIDKKKFVDASKLVTIHLHPLQIRNISSGYLVFLVGERDGKPCLAILKIESQEGSELKWDTGNKNRLDYVKTLLMTNSKTRLYKFAFIHFKPKRRIYAADPQIGSKVENVADFWLKKFLQSESINNPKIRTKEAYEFINKLCNRIDINAEDHIRIRMAFVSEMLSNNETFDLQEFRKVDIDSRIHSIFDDEAKKSQVDWSVFPKDTSLIKSSLQQMVINFEGGIQLRLPIGEWEKSVKLIGKNRIEIHKPILNINGKKPRKG